MNEDTSQNELRWKRGRHIAGYFRQFSSTEKAIFGTLAIAAVVAAIIMAGNVNAYFMTEVPGYGGNLREGVIGLPHTINPVLAVTDVDHDLSALIYSGLMRYKDGSLVPDIARSYDVSSDGLVYTFSLRNDVRFQDGTALTADDIAFTIQKIQDPALKSPRRADWANVIVKVASPVSIQFILKQPYAPFLSNTTVGIIPKHIWGAVGDDQFIFSEYNIDPIGSGPYKTSSISHNAGGIPTDYKISTWTDFYGMTPHVNSITFSFFADEDKALSALDSGAIDSLSSISASDAVRLASDTAESYRILKAPLPRIFGSFMNQSQAPALADKSVRTALDMSVDRATIIKMALDGYGLPLHGPLPFNADAIAPATPSSVSTSSMTGPDRSNIAGAQALLEKNGWKKNATGIYEKKGKTSTVTLSFDIYTADTPDLKETAEIIKDAWTKLGADVSVKVFESSDLFQNIIRPRKYDVLLFGEFIGTDSDLYPFWHSSQRNSPGLNVSMYANSKADKLLEDIRTTSDDAARKAKLGQLGDMIEADVPAIFLYVPDFIYAVPKSLRGMDLGTITVPADRWDSIENWYLVTDNVWQIFKK